MTRSEPRVPFTGWCTTIRDRDPSKPNCAEHRGARASVVISRYSTESSVQGVLFREEHLSQPTAQVVCQVLWGYQGY